MTKSRERRPQPWPIRLTHWLNVPLLIILAGSGLQIYKAFPALGPRGALYEWFPLQNTPPPSWLRLGGWLAGARALHFAFAWFLIANALVYGVYFFASGEWRRRAFRPRRDFGASLAMIAYYTRLRRDPPPQPDLYNGLQRLAYTSVLIIAVIEVLSGIAIYKPVQLSWLTSMLGGYDAARAIHLFGLVALALFTVGHIVMVATHPRTIAEMITGGKPPEPEPPEPQPQPPEAVAPTPAPEPAEPAPVSPPTPEQPHE